MFSNVGDLSRFVIAFMNQGRIDGREALLPGVIAKLSGPQAAIPGGDASYGFGLQASQIGGVPIVAHGGSRAGYGSTIMMAPSRRVAAIVLGNRTGSGLPNTTRRALELLLGMADGALKEPPRTAIAAPVEPGTLDAWAGRYSQGSGPVIEILVRNGALVVREGMREQPAALAGNRLMVGAAGATQPPASWVLVPDRDGRPEYRVPRRAGVPARPRLTARPGRATDARPWRQRSSICAASTAGIVSRSVSTMRSI